MIFQSFLVVILLGTCIMFGSCSSMLSMCLPKYGSTNAVMVHHACLHHFIQWNSLLFWGSAAIICTSSESCSWDVIWKLQLFWVISLRPGCEWIQSVSAVNELMKINWNPLPYFPIASSWAILESKLAQTWKLFVYMTPINIQFSMAFLKHLFLL